ncbi:MAG: 50S ribosomal protein L25/general stress protein Ctc [Gammaproteobacteria bacterium]|jgi:large subunit ribosomal protein L25
MDIFEIDAESRSERGKGASRRLRRSGKFPAVVYGAHKDPAAIQLDHQEMLLHAEHEAFYSHILTLKIDGKAEKVVVKDMQRHPVKPFIQHMDFLRVSATETLSVRVPLHFINEDHCVGVRQGGGAISHLMNDVEVTCLPKDLPEYIEVDLANLELGASVHLADLVLPEGVQLTSVLHGGDDALPVASVHTTRASTSTDDGGDAEGEEGEESEG